MKKIVTIQTIFNLGIDRQKQYNEDYEFVYRLGKKIGVRDALEFMKEIYELVVENEHKDGYIILYTVTNRKGEGLYSKYAPAD